MTPRHASLGLDRWRCIATLCAVVFVGAASAQCPVPGDCREVHETPGCEQPECCTLVCEFDPFCCSSSWAQSCVDAALELCDGISCPSDGACDGIHPNAGCLDYECCELITTLDGWCTYAAWDELCALEAQLLCGVARCAIVTDGAVNENEACYRRLNDGWAAGVVAARIAAPCGLVMNGKTVGGGPRDLEWFALDGVTRRRLRFTVEAEYPIEVQYLLGNLEGPNEVKWLAGEPLCEGPRSFVLLTEPGTSTLILGVGNEERAYRSGMDCDEINPDFPPDPDDPPPVTLYGLRWRASLECLALADIDGDGTVGAADLSLLLAAWGEIDPTEEIDPRAPDADLDGDGQVGAADLSLLLVGW